MTRHNDPAAAPSKPRAPHGSRNGPKGAPPAMAENPVLPAFDPVPRKFRHDGWTPARQQAFIGALADTGCVNRAARYVNMSPEGAYWLRRQKGSDSFRRAWEAALDLGVQRLKDECYERALEGQLVPVFLGGKLKGFKRVKNDRLLMFALRMNAKDEYGRRMAATYFDPTAPRLHAGSGISDGGERAPLPPLPPAETPLPLAGGGDERHATLITGGPVGTDTRAPTPTRITDTITGPAISRMRRDDLSAAIVADFAPADLTLPEIEAMQAMLSEVAARKRAEEDGPPDQMTDLAFIQNRDEDAFKTYGPLEDIYPSATGEEEHAAFLPEGAEEDWRDLDQEPREVLTDAEWLERAGWGKGKGKAEGGG